MFNEEKLLCFCRVIANTSREEQSRAEQSRLKEWKEWKERKRKERKENESTF